MNPLFDKPVKFQRSTSVKLNPEDEKFKILKQAGYFNRDFSFRTKNLDLPTKAQISDLKVIQKEQQKFLSSKNITTKLFKNLSQNEKSKTQNKNPYNPFDYLTDSSVKKPILQSINQSGKLRQAEIKIKQLSNCIDTLNQQLTLAKINNKKIEEEGLSKSSYLMTELSQLKSQIYALNNEISQFKLKYKILEEENQNLKFTIEQLRNQKVSSQCQKQNNENDSSKFRLLGKEYQKKINDLYEENYKLKNSYTSIQGKLQQNQTLVQSLQKMNQMLQKRFLNYDEQSSIMKEQLRTQNEKLKEECLTLKQEKQLVQSENQIQILRLENEVYELKREMNLTQEQKQGQSSTNSNLFSINQTINNKKLYGIIETLQMALKQQIDETNRLKEKNKKLTKMLAQINQ